MESQRLKRLGVVALLIVATLVWTAGAFGTWAKRQTLDTDNWVETSGELLENEEIRTALGHYLVDQVYDTGAVTERLQDVLPPRLQPLAQPAAAALKQVAQRNVPRVLGLAAALEAWEQANRSAQTTFKRLIDGELPEGGEVNLDLEQLLGRVAADAGLPPDVVDRLPPQAAQLQVLTAENLEGAQDALDLFKTLEIVLWVLGIGLFALAVYLSPDRRRTLVSVGGCIASVGLLLLVLRRLGTDIVVDALAKQPTGEDAVEQVWLIGTSLLAEVAQGSLLAGVLLASGAWLSGPGKRATALRRLAAPALEQNPAATRAALGVLLLLLVVWHPVPWTGRAVPLLLVTVAAFAWLEWLRRRTAEEFSQAPA